MATCHICGLDLGSDSRRKYCDAHRQRYGDGKYRRKGYVAEFFRKNRRKYAMRMTRITGTGFSEHLICDRTGKANFDKERVAVLKEKRRILNARNP